MYLEDLVDRDGDDYLDRHTSDALVPDPLEVIEQTSVRNALVTAIEMLPEREKMMMALYYEQDLNLREIGEVLGVTESRICQLHSQAVARLRAAVVGEAKPIAKAKRGRKPKAAATTVAATSDSTKAGADTGG